MTVVTGGSGLSRVLQIRSNQHDRKRVVVVVFYMYMNMK